MITNKTKLAIAQLVSAAPAFTKLQDVASILISQEHITDNRNKVLNLVMSVAHSAIGAKDLSIAETFLQKDNSADTLKQALAMKSSCKQLNAFVEEVLHCLEQYD